MPVFEEKSNTARDLRILPSRAPPLPRLSASHENGLSSETAQQHEVVVIGVSNPQYLMVLSEAFGRQGRVGYS